MVRVRLAFDQCLMRSEQLERAVAEFGMVHDQEPMWSAPFTPLITALCRLGRVAEAKLRLESLRAVSDDRANLDMLTRLVTRTGRAN